MATAQVSRQVGSGLAWCRNRVKVKNRDALDVVAAAVIGPPAPPTVVVAALPLDEALRMVGRFVPL